MIRTFYLRRTEQLKYEIIYMHKEASYNLADVSRHLAQLKRSNKRLSLVGPGLELTKERPRTPSSRKKRSDQSSFLARSSKTYSRTPLLNSHLGSWTTPLIVTLLISKTESTFAARMYKIAVRAVHQGMLCWVRDTRGCKM